MKALRRWSDASVCRALLWGNGAESAVHGAQLTRLGSGIEPVPVPVGLGAKRGGEIAGFPVDFPRHQGIGTGPVGRRRPAVVDVAHEFGPGGGDDPATS